MRNISFFVMIGLSSVAFADLGVLVKAENDTVLKVTYTGSSPNSLTHPAVTVEGKAMGLNVNAQNTPNAVAVIGRIGSSTLPTTNNTTTGVIGAGSVGVRGKGDVGVIANGGWGVGLSAHGSEYAGYFSGGNVYVVGSIYATGTITQGSDLALKENVRPLPKGLETVMALQPKAYEMRRGVTEVTSEGTQFGLIAQDLQPLIPEIVETKRLPPKRQDGGDIDFQASRQEFLAVNYTGLIPVLINAIQEQQAEIEVLKQEVQLLRGH